MYTIDHNRMENKLKNVIAEYHEVLWMFTIVRKCPRIVYMYSISKLYTIYYKKKNKLLFAII